MPLPESAFHFGECFIGRVLDMRPCKIENRGADAQQHPWADGFEVVIGQDYPPSGTNRSLRFTASKSRRSKWGIWVSYWPAVGIDFGNRIIGPRCLFHIREHVWTMPDGDIAVELPAPICTVGDEDLEFVIKNRVNLETIDAEAAQAGGSIYAGLPAAGEGEEEKEDTPPWEEDEAGSGDSKGADLSLYESLLAVLQEAGGVLEYNQFIVKVLTDPALAGDDAIKEAVTSKERLKELGFGFNDQGQVLPF